MQWFLSLSDLSFNHILLRLLRRTSLQFPLELIKALEGLLHWWQGAVFRIPSWNVPAFVSHWSSSPNAVHCTLSIRSEWLLGSLQIHRNLPGTDCWWRYHDAFTWIPGTIHSSSFLYAFPWLDWQWIFILISPLLFSYVLTTEKSSLLSVTQITNIPHWHTPMRGTRGHFFVCV